MAGPIYSNPSAIIPYIFPVPPPFFVVPASQNNHLISPRSYHGGNRDLLLYALQEERAIDEEYTYLDQTEANQMQTSSLDLSTIPAYEFILKSELQRHFDCRGKAYTIEQQCLKRMEWISCYAQEIGAPIQWMIRGSEVVYQLGEVFFKEKLTQKHPQHASPIAQIDLRNLKVPPGDVDLQARCRNQNKAHEIGEAQFLFDVFYHFESLEFELSYPNDRRFRSGKHTIQGAESLCFWLYLSFQRNDALPVCIRVSNKTIPWMYKKEWPGQKVEALSTAVMHMKDKLEAYHSNYNYSILILKEIYHELTPLLFNCPGLTEFTEELKKGLQTSIEPHDVNRQDEGGNYTHLCHRTVLTRHDGKQFDFTHFNSYTTDSELCVTTGQNIYLELADEPLKLQQAKLHWTYQAILDQSFGIFRVPRQNLKDLWPYYCYALTQGQLCPQKGLRQLLFSAFQDKLKLGDPVTSANKALENRADKILRKYSTLAPLFSFLFHATRDLEKIVRDAIWNTFLPEISSALDPRLFASQTVLEGVLILRYLLTSPAAQQQGNLNAKLTTQHNESCLAFYFFGYPLIVPFDPLKALQVLKPYTQTKEQIDPLIAVSQHLRLGDHREVQSHPLVMPLSNQDDWFNQLREYISTPHLAELGFILLHNSTTFADPYRVYQEATEQADKLIALPNRREEVCEWLIQSASWSQLVGDMRKTWIETLQTAKTPPPDWNLRSSYLALKRKASLSTARENVREAVAALVPTTQPLEPVTSIEISKPATPEVQPIIQLTPFPITFAEVLKQNLPPPALANPKTARKKTANPAPILSLEALETPAATSAASTHAPIRSVEKVAKKPTKPLREEAVQKEEPSVPLTEEQQLEQLIDEFSKPNGLRNYKAIERLIALPTTGIPNLDPIYAYFKDLVPSIQELKFARNLFKVLLDRGALKNCKELFSAILVKHFPLQFDATERVFWIQTAKTLIEKKDWEGVYDLLIELDQRCVEEREDLLAVFKDIPLAGLKANPIRYADVMARLEVTSGKAFQEHLDQILQKPNPTSLRKLLQFLVQAQTLDVVTWVLFFQAVIDLKNKDLLIESYQAGQQLLEKINHAEEPFTWTHLQIFVNTLLFKIYLLDPSSDNFLKIRKAWDNLLGPAEHADARCYSFISNLLSTIHTCSNIDPALLSCLESWVPPLLFTQEPLKRNQLNYYYGSLLTRQRGIPTDSRRAGLEQMAEAIPYLGDVPASMLEYALNCFADDQIVSKHFMASEAPLLVKLAQHLVAEASRDPKLLNPTPYLVLLESYRSRLAPSSDLAQSLLRSSCDLIHQALDHPVVFATEVSGVMNLLHALNDTPGWLDEAFLILEKTQRHFDTSRDPVAVQIRIKFARKKVLEELQSEKFAKRVTGITQLFEGLDGIYLQAQDIPSIVSHPEFTLRVLYNETCQLMEHSNRSASQLLISASILSTLELLRNVVMPGKGDIEIPRERFRSLKKAIVALTQKKDFQMGLFSTHISELKSVEFVKQLLEIKPTNRDVAWILKSTCGHLLRKLFDEDTSSRDHVASLVSLYLFHPSFHLPSLESFGICQLKSLLNRYDILYKKGQSINNVLPLHQLCLTLNHSLPLKPLPSRLNISLYEDILKKLIPLGTFLALQQSLNLLIKYPLLLPSETEREQIRAAEERTAAQKKWIGQILEQLGRNASPKSKETPTPSLDCFNRLEKIILYDKCIHFLRNNPSLSSDHLLYASIFTPCLPLLKRCDRESALLFEQLVYLHLRDCAIERASQDPKLFETQRSQLVGFFMLFSIDTLAHVKKGFDKSALPEEELPEINIFLNSLELLMPYLPENFKKELPWDVIQKFKALFPQNCFDVNTNSKGVQVIYQRP